MLLLTCWLPDNVQVLRLRGYIAHFFISRCGTNLRLGRGITFYNPQNIEIGNDVYIAQGNWFSASEKIVLEDQVIIGPKCVFAASNHTKQDGSYRFGPPDSQPIKVGRGSWIAAQCSILAGAEIGEGVLVAANSVVNRSLPSHSICAGSPARVIRETENSK